jgi:DNA transformation protein and related proteins
MATQPQYLAYILEQLAGLPALRSNRMFGGVGLYSDGLFFALIDDDTLYFKTGDINVAAYSARRMPRFMPFPDRPEAVLGYHQVPADIIEDAELLVDWARQSVAVALKAQAAKPARARTAGKQKLAKKKAANKKGAKKSARTSAARKPRTAANQRARRPAQQPARKK